MKLHASDCTVSVKLCISRIDNASHEETNGIVLGLTTFLSLLNKPNYVALHPVNTYNSCAAKEII